MLKLTCVFVWKLGTLGAGNHYAEIQVVDEIYNDYAAKKMGIDHKGQVCVMIHSGSRGLGHQVATGGRRDPARTLRDCTAVSSDCRWQTRWWPWRRR